MNPLWRAAVERTIRRQYPGAEIVELHADCEHVYMLSDEGAQHQTRYRLLLHDREFEPGEISDDLADDDLRIYFPQPGDEHEQDHA